MNSTQACWDNTEVEELLKNEKAQREKMLKNYEEEKILLSQQIRQSEKNRYNDDIQFLQDKNNNLIKLNADITHQRIEFHQKITESLTNKFEEKEEKLRKEYEEKIKKEQDKYETAFARTINSTILGQVGENLTWHKLNRTFPKAEIEDCRKKSGRGDFIMTEGDFVMMIETKNYTNNVLKPEIIKFYRDVDNNNDIKCALFISLKSGICAREDFHFEVRNDKPILFLHNLEENIENLQLAVRFFKLILNTNKIDLGSKEMLEKIKNMIPAIKKNWRKMRKSLQNLQKTMDNSISEQEKFIIDLFQLIAIKY